MSERTTFRVTDLFGSRGLKWPGRLILAILFLFTAGTLPAQHNDKIVLFLSDDNGAYRMFRERLEQLSQADPESGNNPVFFNINKLDHDMLQRITRDAAVVVTAGKKSTIALSRINSPAPHIATLLTREDYMSILSQRADSTGRHCGIVIDQPPDRITGVINRELPDTRRIGIIESADDNTSWTGDIDSANHGIEVIRTKLDGDIHAAIKLLAKKEVDAIVALHNKAVYNRGTARNILISSYHFNIPVIGYSSAFVKAGALIGIYSRPESLADETYNYINDPTKCKNGNVIHPGTYTIKVNPQVAKSLGINISTDNPEKTIRKGSRP